jgi:hypothetical protein
VAFLHALLVIAAFVGVAAIPCALGLLIISLEGTIGRATRGLRRTFARLIGRGDRFVAESAGQAPDGGPLTAGGPFAGGGRSADAGRFADGGQGLDGGSFVDSGPALDGGSFLDGGPFGDGGPALDGGSFVDGGPLVDGGRSADSGDRGDRSSRGRRADRADRADRAGRADHAGRADRADRADRAGRADHADHAGRADRAGRASGGQGQGKGRERGRGRRREDQGQGGRPLSAIRRVTRAIGRRFLRGRLGNRWLMARLAMSVRVGRKLEHSEPTSPPIQQVAADLRRLNRQRLSIAMRSRVWFQAVQHAYDDRLGVACQQLGIEQHLDELTGMDLDLERIRVEGLLEEAGLAFRDDSTQPRHWQL